MSEELRQLRHDAIIELFELNLNPIGQNLILRFCSAEQTANANVSLGGNQFQSWPIKADGFEISSKGALPEPSIAIANYQSVITALIIAYNPAGAKLTRRRIFAKHLDGGASPNPAAEFQPDEFILDSWSENVISCAFRMVTALEYLNLQIPKRRIVSLRNSN